VDGLTDGQGATLNAAPWMVALSITFQYRLNESCMTYATERQKI